jgi:branched-chain amino acid transport system substrate-binding protein
MSSKKINKEGLEVKKRVTLLVGCVILTLSLALTGCTPAAPTETPAEEPEVVKVGWIGSLTGDQAVWGTCELNTVKMLFEDINAKGGLLGKQGTTPAATQPKPLMR